MAIQVTCPSCMKRFTVSDKFAGKSGPCPNCQKTIKIPEKSEEVVIHAPEDAGPKDSKGRSVLKPVRRSEVKLSPLVITIAAVLTVGTIATAVGIGVSGGGLPTPALAVFAFLLAVPLAFVGYWFLRDDELQAYLGKPLYVRLAICATIFALTWAIYAWIPMYLFNQGSMAETTGLTMAVMIPVVLILGSIASIAIFELEVVSGVMHYACYFAITFVLAWIAGVPLAEPLSGGASTSATEQTAPVQPNTQPTAPVPSTPDPNQPKVPNLLQ